MEIIDVSEIDGIKEAKYISWDEREDVETDIEFNLPTGGGLALTLENGDVFIFTTSEWATLEIKRASG